MTPSPPVAPDDGLIRPLLETAGGFLLGAVTAFVGFRTRFSQVEGRLASHDQQFVDMANDHTVELTRFRADIERRHQENVEREARMERRQMFTLKLIADVARKLGVDNRVDDVVIEFLTADTED